MCRLPMPAQPEVINSSNPSQTSRPERAEDVRLMHRASKHVHHQILTSPHACLREQETCFGLCSDPGRPFSFKDANSECATWTFFFFFFVQSGICIESLSQFMIILFGTCDGGK